MIRKFVVVAATVMLLPLGWLSADSSSLRGVAGVPMASPAGGTPIVPRPVSPRAAATPPVAAPAINCLFLTEDIACSGSRDPVDPDNGCFAAREIRLRRNPTSFFGCEAGGEQPRDACMLLARDPLCDGFAPGSE